jgi:hypothetical protein
MEGGLEDMNDLSKPFLLVMHKTVWDAGLGRRARKCANH